MKIRVLTWVVALFAIGIVILVAKSKPANSDIASYGTRAPLRIAAAVPKHSVGMGFALGRLQSVKDLDGMIQADPNYSKLLPGAILDLNGIPERLIEGSDGRATVSLLAAPPQRSLGRGFARSPHTVPAKAVRVDLTSESLRIEPMAAQGKEKALDPNGGQPSRWEWRVVGSTPGEHEVELGIQPLVEMPGQGSFVDAVGSTHMSFVVTVRPKPIGVRFHEFANEHLLSMVGLISLLAGILSHVLTVVAAHKLESGVAAVAGRVFKKKKSGTKGRAK